jgi:hypothetical protein
VLTIFIEIDQALSQKAGVKNIKYSILVLSSRNVMQAMLVILVSIVTLKHVKGKKQMKLILIIYFVLSTY